MPRRCAPRTVPDGAERPVTIREEVIELIRKRGPMSRHALYAALTGGWARDSVKNELARMEKRGEIEWRHDGIVSRANLRECQ